MTGEIRCRQVIKHKNFFHERLWYKCRLCKHIRINNKLTFSSLWTSSPASPPSSRSLIFLHLSLDSCQLATECQTIMHHPLISLFSIVACMEAVKFFSTWTLSFSVHSLYWVVEGRVAKGAEVEREEEQLEIENLHLDLSVGCSGYCSLSSLLVLNDLLFLVPKGHALKLLIFRLVVKETILVFTHENQLKNKDSASLSIRMVEYLTTGNCPFFQLGSGSLTSMLSSVW